MLTSSSAGAGVAGGADGAVCGVDSVIVMGSVFSSGAVCAASLGKFASESIAAGLVKTAMARSA
jgi:N-acetylneuraminic acid mutarotase